MYIFNNYWCYCMAKEKKKQHFIPQCYLENWQISNKHHIYMYDKTTKKISQPDIKDVAQKRYFYDIAFSEMIKQNVLDSYGFSIDDVKKLEDKQLIENYFANQIEGDYKQQLNRIIQRAKTMTPWEIKHCHFITDEEKMKFTFHLALQLVRVNSVRSSIQATNDCMIQIFHDMGIPQHAIDRHTLSKTQLSFIHGRIILDGDKINETAELLFSLKWLLWDLKTSQSIYTSDNPIGTEEHIHHPFLSMNGLNCRGVEVYFPISPNLMLLMFDGDYHTFTQKHDCKIIQSNDEQDIINRMNIRTIINAERFVFSNTNDFRIIEDLLKKDPTIFSQPKTVVHWGGKAYTPNQT